MPRKAVRRTRDFVRIDQLERRPLLQEEAEELADEMTPHFLCEGASGRLRPWQAYSLAEAAENDGAWLALPVGQGKTLIAELLPVVMQKRRPVLMLPAALREKTYADRAAYRGTWRTASPPPRIITFEEMQRESADNLLGQIKPDLIIIDEADTLANWEASAPQRIEEYVRESGCAVVAMTGTPGRNSIMNYWHLLCWCLKDGAPIPHLRSEASMWAQAIDEKHGRVWRGNVDPGPLGHDRESARRWFAERLRQTPGVVIVDGDSCDAKLSIHIKIARESEDIDQHFKTLMTTGQNPAEIACADPLAMFRAEAQTGCGFCQYYDPLPPEVWRDAARAFARMSSGKIQQSRNTSRPMRTEKQVRRRFADHPIVQEWEEIRPTFEPNTAVEWFCESVLLDVEEWLDSEDEPGAVWCGSVEFAELLAERTGLSYYGRKGKDANGRGLHAHPKGESLISSWHANKRGFNLQHIGRALIVFPPQSAKYLEQTFGRHHRSGRKEEVRITMLATSGAILDAFEAALAEASFVKGTIGMTQKILRAEITRETPTKNKSNRFRWAQRR